MLSLAGISKTFNLDTPSPNPALRGIDLHLEPGEFVTIIGSNGAGKSTLLNAIAGVFPIDSGRIVVDGQDITNWPEHKRASLIGRVFQDPMMGTAASMSIEENLAMAAKRGERRGFARGVNVNSRARFREMLADLGLGLENRLSDKVKLLSGGQRQSLTLLMATISRPKLLLLDEHTAALDPKTAQQVAELTNQIVKSAGLTVLMVTHNMEHALNTGTRTVMMHEGQIIFDVSGDKRAKMTVADLLNEFSRLRGESLADDRLLLG
ncbi:MAG: ABC transporter ATP-binding protein [Firmicutes bacterium]|nr:ABC transporter ATP-binding protein [Bacillota bacterium]